jgi:hypothetical protein
MVYISESSQSLFAINASLNTLSRIIRQMRDVKIVDGISMDED